MRGCSFSVAADSGRLHRLEICPALVENETTNAVRQRTTGAHSRCCPVEGDSILIISPTSKAVLIDAGDNNKGKVVLEALSVTTCSNSTS